MGSDSFCIIDDEPDVLEGLCENMRALGSVTGFTSAQAALEAFAQGLTPAVTVVDLKMPDMGGLDFIKRCRESHLGGVMVLASGNAGKNDLAKALNLGTSGFLEKPFSAIDLRKTVQLVMRSAFTQDEARAELYLEHWQNLTDVYFELWALVENHMVDSGHAFLPESSDKSRYLQLKIREHDLRKAIEEMDEN